MQNIHLTTRDNGAKNVRSSTVFSTEKTMREVYQLIVTILLFCTALPMQAQIFKCEEGGKVAYQAQPCAGGKRLDKESPAQIKKEFVPERCERIVEMEYREQEFQKRAEVAILARLKDPYSAKIAFLLFSPLQCASGRKIMVCGMVNARGGYGGYGGPKIWVYTADESGAGSAWSEEDSDPEHPSRSMGKLNDAGLCMQHAKK